VALTRIRAIVRAAGADSASPDRRWFLVLEHRLQQILIYHCYNEFTDEFADLHIPERRLKRELPDHVVSER
jgi:hypothetical protein